MRLVESILIAARPSQVWPLLAEPQSYRQWNKKVVKVEAPEGALHIGSRFRIATRLGNKDRKADVEVVDFLEPTKLGLLYHYKSPASAQVVLVTYELIQDTHDRTLLRQAVDLQDSGIPKLWQLVLWLLHRFGVSVEAGPLQRLAGLACAGSSRKI